MCFQYQGKINSLPSRRYEKNNKETAVYGNKNDFQVRKPHIKKCQGRARVCVLQKSVQYGFFITKMCPLLIDFVESLPITFIEISARTKWC